MIEKMKRNWQQFRESEPGYRFQDRYRRRQRSGSGRFDPRKVFNVGLGIAIVLVSVFFGWAPGPGWATFFLGLWITAGEFLLVARFLDRAEVRSRGWARTATDIWTGSSPVVKILIVLLILSCAAALGYGAYYLVFGR